jgi:hypothetical protein
MTEEGLPDDWFQGRVSFSDDLKIVDTTTGDIFSLYTFSEKEGEFDITNIDLSQNNDLITFIRKQDSTLWLVNTNNLKH